MLATVGLFDVQHTMHPDTPCVPTYKGGKNTIDGIFASSSLIIGNSRWLAFGENIGDHPMLWWDVPQSTLIGEEIYKIAHPQVRRLNNDPCAQKKYCDKLETYFTNHKIQERLLKIQNQALDSSPTSTQHALNKIDSEITAYMLAAERRCRKLYMNNNPYSPTLSRSGWQIRYWRSICKQKKGRRVSNTAIHRMGKKAGIINGLSHTLEEAQARLTTALKTFYKEIKPDAPNLREEFLDGLAAARAEAKGTSFEAERKTLRYEEATKNIFRQIKA